MPIFSFERLIVLRHGECRHNVDGKYAGWQDTPLTAKGISQARECANILKNAIPDLGGFRFISSPLSRATVSLEIMLEALELSARGHSTDNRLREIDFGDNSGRAASEVQKELSTATQQDIWNYTHPSGESQAALCDRVGRFLEDLVEDSVIVCHSGPARMIRSHLLEISRRETLSFKLGHGKALFFHRKHEYFLYSDLS